MPQRLRSFCPEIQKGFSFLSSFPPHPFFSLLSSPCADAQKSNSKIMVAMGGSCVYFGKAASGGRPASSNASTPRLRALAARDSRHCAKSAAVRAALRSLITSAGRPPGLRLSPTRTTSAEFGTMLAHPVAAWELAVALATTGCCLALARGLFYFRLCAGAARASVVFIRALRACGGWRGWSPS